MTSALLGQLVHHDFEAGAYAFYSWHNVVIACWSQQATGPAMQRFAQLRENLAREHPEGVSVVYLIANGAGLPTSEARTIAGELMER
jgi:acyl CoA:acetate/3-ketoacid CoA transferase alpha subunit